MWLKTKDFSCILNCFQKTHNNRKVKSMLGKCGRGSWTFAGGHLQTFPLGCQDEEGLSRVEQVRNTLVETALVSRRGWDRPKTHICYSESETIPVPGRLKQKDCQEFKTIPQEQLEALSLKQNQNAELGNVVYAPAAITKYQCGLLHSSRFSRSPHLVLSMLDFSLWFAGRERLLLTLWHFHVSVQQT